MTKTLIYLVLFALMAALFGGCGLGPAGSDKCGVGSLFDSKTRTCLSLGEAAAVAEVSLANTLTTVQLFEDLADTIKLTYSRPTGVYAVSCTVSSTSHVQAGTCYCIGGDCYVSLVSDLNYYGPAVDEAHNLPGEFYYLITDNTGRSSVKTPVSVEIFPIADLPVVLVGDSYVYEMLENDDAELIIGHDETLTEITALMGPFYFSTELERNLITQLDAPFRAQACELTNLKIDGVVRSFLSESCVCTDACLASFKIRGNIEGTDPVSGSVDVSVCHPDPAMVGDSCVGGGMWSNPKTVSLSVTPETDLPDGDITAATVIEDSDAVVIQLTTPDYVDDDGEQPIGCQIAGVSQKSGLDMMTYGACTCDPDFGCSVSITLKDISPNLNSSSDSFYLDYQLQDLASHEYGAVARLVLTVTPVNDLPLLKNVAGDVIATLPDLEGFEEVTTLLTTDIFKVDEGGASDENSQNLYIKIVSQNALVVADSGLTVKANNVSIGAGGAFRSLADSSTDAFLKNIIFEIVPTVAALADGGLATLAVEVCDTAPVSDVCPSDNKVAFTFNVTILTVNDAPVITIPTEYLSGTSYIVGMNEGAFKTVNIALDEGGASDEDVQLLTVKISSNNANLVPSSEITCTSFGVNPQLLKTSSPNLYCQFLEAEDTDASTIPLVITINPVAGVSGDAQITLTVEDDGSPSQKRVTNFIARVYSIGALHGGWKNVQSAGPVGDGASIRVKWEDPLQAGLNGYKVYVTNAGVLPDSDALLVTSADAGLTYIDLPMNVNLPVRGNIYSYWVYASHPEYVGTETSYFVYVRWTAHAAGSYNLYKQVWDCSTGTCIMESEDSTPFNETPYPGAPETYMAMGLTAPTVRTKEIRFKVVALAEVPEVLDSAVSYEINRDIFLATEEIDLTSESVVRLDWNAFTMVGASVGGYNVYRSLTPETFDYDEPLNLTPLASTRTYFIDNSTNSDPAQGNLVAGQVYFYEVRPLDNLRLLPTPTLDVFNKIRVLAPDANKVFVHRWIVNKDICTLLHQTCDPTNNYRCDYAGVGQSPDGNYYDIGHDLVLDRYEAGCPYTRADELITCGSNGCIGMSAPTMSATDGSIYYSRDEGRCYVRDGSSWTGAEALDLTKELAETMLNNSTKPALPPLSRFSQAQAQAVCMNRVGTTYTGVVTESIVSRLPRRNEQIAFSSWRTDKTATEIDSLEGGLNLDTGSRCNTSEASGLTSGYIDAPAPFSQNFYSLPGTSTSGIRTMATGSSQTRECYSRYLAQDVTGNVNEWSSDQMICLKSNLSIDASDVPFNSLICDTWQARSRCPFNQDSETITSCAGCKIVGGSDKECLGEYDPNVCAPSPATSGLIYYDYKSDNCYRSGGGTWSLIGVDGKFNCPVSLNARDCWDNSSFDYVPCYSDITPDGNVLPSRENLHYLDLSTKICWRSVYEADKEQYHWSIIDEVDAVPVLISSYYSLPGVLDPLNRGLVSTDTDTVMTTDQSYGVFRFDGERGPCNESGGYCKGDLFDWLIGNKTYDAGYFLIPLGLPQDSDYVDTYGDDDVTPFLMKIGQSSGIPLSTLHSDYITIDTSDIKFDPLEGPTYQMYGIVSGGSSKTGSAAGRWYAWFHEVATGGVSGLTEMEPEMGLRCVSEINPCEYEERQFGDNCE